jgi:hypothetical protein
MAKWRDFEVLIAKISSDIAPGATVEHNVKIQGRSGRTRQVDVSIRSTVGLFPIFVAIECRYYRRAVTIDKVEAFVTKLQDISAHQGVRYPVSVSTLARKRQRGRTE